MGASFSFNPGVSSFSWMAQFVRLYLKRSKKQMNKLVSEMELWAYSEIFSEKGDAMPGRVWRRRVRVPEFDP